MLRVYGLRFFGAKIGIGVAIGIGIEGTFTVYSQIKDLARDCKVLNAKLKLRTA